MKALKTLLIFISSLFFSIANGQRFTSLKVGDKIPDVIITHFFNEPTRKEKISNLYNDRLLILDFWGTWCGACLEEFPRFDALKKHFGDKIQILAVGYESKERMTGLFKRNPSLNSPNYLTIYADSILTYKLFPHKLLPHLAWVDKNGMVIGITSGEYVNEKYINEVLSGKGLVARTKADNKDFGVSAIYKPFHLRDTDFLGRSILTRGIIGGASFSGFQGDSVVNDNYFFSRAFMGNNTIYDLYWDALFHGRRSHINPSILRFEIKDSTRYFTPKKAPKSYQFSKYKTYDEWADVNLYVYDLVLPKKVGEFKLREYMLNDLNRYFNLNARYENREVDCWILSEVKQNSKRITIDSVERAKVYYNTSIVKRLNLDQFIELLNHNINQGLVVNGILNNNDFTITLDTDLKFSSPEQLNKILIGLGYELIPGRRQVQMYVVSEF